MCLFSVMVRDTRRKPLVRIYYMPHDCPNKLLAKPKSVQGYICSGA